MHENQEEAIYTTFFLLSSSKLSFINQCKQAYRELQIDFDKNKLKQNGNITFEKLYEEFLQSYRNKVKPPTIMILRRAIEDHALRYIGKKKIKDINVRLCTRMNEEWISDGHKQAYYFRRAVAQILQYAVQQELIYENAMRETPLSIEQK